MIAQARLALEKFDTATAETILRTLISAEPTNADAYAELGLALCYSQREFEAAGLLSRAKGGERFEKLTLLLGDHFQCRQQMAKKLKVEDHKGRTALNQVLPFAKPCKKGVRLSACLIVKNEEKQLERCLRSLKGVADEIVVIDTGSTDRTLEIAKKHKAVIGHFDWCEDFSAARNESLRLATGDWVLWIDADEELCATSHSALREGLIRPHFGGYFIQIVNFMAEEGDANQYVHTPVRLFQRFDGLRFDGRVHEQVLPSLNEAGLVCASLHSVVLNHYGYMPEAMAEKDKLNRTLTMLEREVGEFPDDPFQLFNLANAYSVGRMHEKAAEAASRAISILDGDAPYGPVTYQILASALIAMGRPEEALRVCEQAEARGFSALTVVFERAHAFYRLREFHLALMAIEKCMAMEWPEWLTGDIGITTHKAHVLKGQILLVMGRLTEASGCIEHALSVDPTFSLAIFAKAFLLERLGRLEEAYGLFSHSAIVPDLREASLKICGHISVAQGRNDLAVEHFSTVWQEFPTATDAWAGMVQALEAQGRFEEACASYEANPSLNSDLMVNWGRTLEMLNRNEEAAEKYQAAVAMDGNANAFFNLGDLLYRGERFIEAATAYESGLQAAPRHAPGWFVLGNAFAQMGMPDGAKIAYEQALAIDPMMEAAKKNLETVLAA